jgi:ABC-type lipoprotein release transport system permease subunit
MTISNVAFVALVIMPALVTVASFASWLPARPAATVDPSQILRSE